MSLLQPVVDKLFSQKNVVMMSPTSTRRGNHTMHVQAVALFTIGDVPKQLLFCKEQGTPMVFTNEMVQNPEAQRAELIDAVTDFDDTGYHFRFLQGRPEESPVNELFAMLLSGAYDHEYVKLLEFLPTKEIYQHFHSNALATFDGVDKFMDEQGMFHFPKAMINLEYVGERRGPVGPRFRDEQRPDLPFGNILMWCDNGNIWFVTKRDQDSLPLGLHVIASACDHNEFIRFTREYEYKGWRVRGVNPMPYNLPKPDAGFARGGIKKPLYTEKQTREMLTEILQQEPGKLDDATSITLGAIYQRHFQQDSKATLEQYMAAAERAINEAFICIDGVGVKKRAEIKDGLLQHFRKQFELNAK